MRSFSKKICLKFMIIYSTKFWLTEMKEAAVIVQLHPFLLFILIKTCIIQHLHSIHLFIVLLSVLKVTCVTFLITEHLRGWMGPFINSIFNRIDDNEQKFKVKDNKQIERKEQTKKIREYLGSKKYTNFYSKEKSSETGLFFLWLFSCRLFDHNYSSCSYTQ